MIELFTAIDEYLKAHPDAQDPKYFLIAFGVEDMLDIIAEANGRKIIFNDIPGLLDAAEYHYE